MNMSREEISQRINMMCTNLKVGEGKLTRGEITQNEYDLMVKDVDKRIKELKKNKK